MAILGDLLVQGSSRFLQHIYASGLTVSDDFSATGDLSVGGAATIAGTLTLTKTQDLSGTANSGPALIIGGAATSTHIEIDCNEIQAKKTGTTTDILYLNHDGGEVQISKSGAATKILGTLTTSGAATFSSTTTFSGASTHSSNLTVNGTTSLKGTGISGTLNVSGDTTLSDTSITDLIVSNNAKINKTLIVEEEIRTPKWIVDNIANLGGEFIVAPTIIAENATSVQVAQASGGTRLLTITDNSITSDTFGGIVWKAGSIVKISGTLGDTVLTSVNGTMTEKLNTSSKVLRVNVATTDLDGIPEATTTYSLSGGTIKNLHIMMYKVGGAVPVGIFLTSYGNSIEHYPYLEVYSGTTTGTSYSPTVRLGYLPSLKNDNGTDLTVNNITPTGWGLYTSNGYFSGTIVSNSGKIGGWEIGTASLYNGTTSMNDTHAGLYFGRDGEENPKWGIRSYKDANTYVNIIDGKITALGVDLTGEITATSGTIGGLTIKNSYITSNTSKTTYNNTSVDGVFIGPTGIGLGKGKFYVSNTGALTATSGTIAGWTIGANTISHGTLGAASGYMLNSAGNSNTTINGTNKTNWALTIGNKFGVDNEGNLYANGANITNITIGNTDINIGGRNLLPYTQSKPYTTAQTSAGITVSYDQDGWFSVSGTPTSGRSGASFVALWRNTADNYSTPVNNLVPQTGGEELTISVEIEGTPFSAGTTYTNSTHIVFYGTSSSQSIRLGGYSTLSYTNTPTYYISRVEYYVGKDANTSTAVNGRFRIKLEKGNVATIWTPAPEDVDQNITNAVTHIDGGNITTGNISADRIKTNLLTAINASITKLSALTATIGGFTIKDTYITSNTSKTTYNNTSVDGVFIGTTGIGLGKGKFYVSNAGALTATSAVVTGTINATGGYFGASDTAGWKINGNAIQHITSAGLGKTGNYILNAAGNTSASINNISKTNWALTIGSKFGVDNDGVLYASGLNITNIDINNTNLEIGGRNLLRESASLTNTEFWTPDHVTVEYDETSKLYKITAVNYTNSWWGVYQKVSVEPATQYTLSVTGKSDTSTARLGFGTDAGWGSEHLSFPTELTRESITFTTGASQTEIRITLVNRGSTDGVVWFSYPKLEQGNVATVWTPAPEDVTDFVNTRNSETGAIIDSALDAITSAQSAADNAAAAALLAQSTADDALQDANTANTAAANAQNKADQTASDLQSFRNNYENYVASVTQTYVTADSFNVKVDAIDNTFKQYSDWMTFTRINDNPTLEIGTTDSHIKGRFSNQGLNFVSGNDILLDLDGEHSKVIANNLDISTKITIGEYAWTPNGDGISLVYIGES